MCVHKTSKYRKTYNLMMKVSKEESKGFFQDEIYQCHWADLTDPGFHFMFVTIIF